MNVRYTDRHQTWSDRVVNSYQIARREFSEIKFKGRVTLGGMILMAAYEWGPGNETLTPIIGGRFLDAAEGVEGIAMTAGVTGGFVTLQQLTSSYLARKTAAEFPDVSRSIFENNQNHKFEENNFKPFKNLSKIKKLGYSALLGSTFTVMREVAVTGTNNDKLLKNVGRQSAIISGVSVATVGAGVDTINQTFDNNESVQLIMDWGVKNPLVWLGALGAYLAVDYIKKKGH